MSGPPEPAFASCAELRLRTTCLLSPARREMLAALIEKQCSERKVNEPRRARFGVERERQHCDSGMKR